MVGDSMTAGYPTNGWASSVPRNSVDFEILHHPGVMDCVTCILVGVCVMCGPGFGAQSPGRPMTEAELSQALENILLRFQTPDDSSSMTSSYSRRQSFIPDVRFTDIGIGKRNRNHNRVESIHDTDDVSNRHSSSRLSSILRRMKNDVKGKHRKWHMLRWLVKQRTENTNNNRQPLTSSVTKLSANKTNMHSLGKVTSFGEMEDSRVGNFKNSKFLTKDVLIQRLKRAQMEEFLLTKLIQDKTSGR